MTAGHGEWRPGDLFPFKSDDEQRWGKLLAYVEEEDGWIWQQVAPMADRFQRRNLVPATKLVSEERPQQDLLLCLPLHGDMGHVLALTEAQAQALETQLGLYGHVLRSYDVAWRELQRRLERAHASKRLGHTDERKRPRKTHEQVKLEGEEAGSRRAANAALHAMALDVAALLPFASSSPRLHPHDEWAVYAALADNPRFQSAAEKDDVPAALEADNHFGMVTVIGPRERQKRREERERRREEMPERALRWRAQEQEEARRRSVPFVATGSDA